MIASTYSVNWWFNPRVPHWSAELWCTNAGVLWHLHCVPNTAPIWLLLTSAVCRDCSLFPLLIIGGPGFTEHTLILDFHNLICFSWALWTWSYWESVLHVSWMQHIAVLYLFLVLILIGCTRRFNLLDQYPQVSPKLVATKPSSTWWSCHWLPHPGRDRTER